MTLVLIASRICNFDLIVVSLDQYFNVFPLNLIVFILILILVLRDEMQNESVFQIKIMRRKLNSTLFISLNDLSILIRICLSIAICFSVLALFLSFLLVLYISLLTFLNPCWQFLVFHSPDHLFVLADFDSL